MEFLLPLVSFIVVVALTPGPNNLLLASVGMRFGFKAAVPQLIGIQVGASALLILCALGLDRILVYEPRTLWLLKLFGSIYLVYLAWKILGINVRNEQLEANPLTVVQSILFQFTNPKAWLMATTGLGVALAVLPNVSVAVAALIAGFTTVGLLCNLMWVWSGLRLQILYQQQSPRFWINAVLATLTALTVIGFWLP